MANKSEGTDMDLRRFPYIVKDVDSDGEAIPELVSVLSLRADKLIDDYKIVAQTTVFEYIAIFNYIAGWCNDMLKDIETFVDENKEKLITMFSFIGENLFPQPINLLTIFNSLSIQDRHELVTKEWMLAQASLARGTSWMTARYAFKSDAYLLMVRLFHGHQLDRSLYRRHPHLFALIACEDEIAKMITDTHQDDLDMRRSASIFSNVANISEGSLVSKCLAYIRQSQKPLVSVSIPLLDGLW